MRAPERDILRMISPQFVESLAPLLTSPYSITDDLLESRRHRGSDTQHKKAGESIHGSDSAVTNETIDSLKASMQWTNSGEMAGRCRVDLRSE